MQVAFLAERGATMETLADAVRGLLPPKTSRWSSFSADNFWKFRTEYHEILDFLWIFRMCSPRYHSCQNLCSLLNSAFWQRPRKFASLAEPRGDAQVPFWFEGAQPWKRCEFCLTDQLAPEGFCSGGRRRHHRGAHLAQKHASRRTSKGSQQQQTWPQWSQRSQNDSYFYF